MNELAEWKEVNVITFFDWWQLIAEADTQEIFRALNSWNKFLKIWWTIINISDIKRISNTKINPVQEYIISEKDPVKRERLQEIFKERTDKKLRISNIQHLLDIYESRYSKKDEENTN